MKRVYADCPDCDGEGKVYLGMESYWTRGGLDDREIYGHCELCDGSGEAEEPEEEDNEEG
jgi:hypothetical protein